MDSFYQHRIYRTNAILFWNIHEKWNLSIYDMFDKRDYNLKIHLLFLMVFTSKQNKILKLN